MAREENYGDQKISNNLPVTIPLDSTKNEVTRLLVRTADTSQNISIRNTHG